MTKRRRSKKGRRKGFIPYEMALWLDKGESYSRAIAHMCLSRDWNIGLAIQPKDVEDWMKLPSFVQVSGTWVSIFLCETFDHIGIFRTSPPPNPITLTEPIFYALLFQEAAESLKWEPWSEFEKQTQAQIEQRHFNGEKVFEQPDCITVTHLGCVMFWTEDMKELGFKKGSYFLRGMRGCGTPPREGHSRATAHATSDVTAQTTG